MYIIFIRHHIEVVIHQPTGIVYLACSTPTSRTHWTPAVLRLNASGASRDDYVATYDPKTSRVTRLKPANFDSPRGLSLHGMDVVPSSVDSSELFVYLVNHRAPTGGQLAKEVGADSVVEIFKTKVGSSTLTHVKTVEDSVISTPNDVIGYGNGKSFYVTNDHGVNKIGLVSLSTYKYLCIFISSRSENLTYLVVNLLLSDIVILIMVVNMQLPGCMAITGLPRLQTILYMLVMLGQVALHSLNVKTTTL